MLLFPALVGEAGPNQSWISFVFVFLLSLHCCIYASFGLSASSNNVHGIVEDVQFQYTLKGAMGMQNHRPISILASPFQVDNDGLKRNQKIIHFQRHAQGFHNLIGELHRQNVGDIDIASSNPQLNPFVLPEIIDSPLTEKGRQQCLTMQKQISSAHGKTINPQAIIVSPLTRTIETAKITFSSYHSGNSVPWIAHEDCREHLGFLTCNKRRPLSELQSNHPHLDCSYMKDEEDTLWNPNEWEAPIDMSNRAYSFLTEFIQNRPETELAVVTHSAFLYNMCNTVLQFTDQPDQNNNKESDFHSFELQPWFDTCEIKSYCLTFERR